VSRDLTSRSTAALQSQKSQPSCNHSRKCNWPRFRWTRHDVLSSLKFESHQWIFAAAFRVPNPGWSWKEILSAMVTTPADRCFFKWPCCSCGRRWKPWEPYVKDESHIRQSRPYFVPLIISQIKPSVLMSRQIGTFWGVPKAGLTLSPTTCSGYSDGYRERAKPDGGGCANR